MKSACGHRRKSKSYKDMRRIRTNIVYNEIGEPKSVPVLVESDSCHHNRTGHQLSSTKPNSRDPQRRSQQLSDFESCASYSGSFIFSKPDLCKTMKLVCKLFHEKISANAYALKNHDPQKSIIDITNQHFICLYGSTSIKEQRLNDFFGSILTSLGFAGLLRVMARMLRLEGTAPLSSELEDIFFGMKGWLHDRGFANCRSSIYAWSCFSFPVSRNHLELSFRETVSSLGWSFPPKLIRAIGFYIWSFGASCYSDQELWDEKIDQVSDQGQSWWFAQDGRLVDMHEVLEGVIMLIDRFDQKFQRLIYDVFGDGAIPRHVLVPYSLKRIVDDKEKKLERESGLKDWREETIASFRKLQQFMELLIVQDESRQGRISEKDFRNTWIKWKKEFSLNIREETEIVDSIGLIFGDCSGMVGYVEVIAMVHAEIVECTHIPSLTSIRRDDGSYRSFEKETCEKLVDFVKYYRFKRYSTEMVCPNLATRTDSWYFQRGIVSPPVPFSAPAPLCRARACPPIKEGRYYFKRPYTCADLSQNVQFRSDDIHVMSAPRMKMTPLKLVDMSFSGELDFGSKQKLKKKTDECLTKDHISAQCNVTSTENHFDIERFNSKFSIVPNLHIHFPGYICSADRNQDGHIISSVNKRAGISITDPLFGDGIISSRSCKIIKPELPDLKDHLNDLDATSDLIKNFAFARKMCDKRRRSHLRCDSFLPADGVTKVERIKLKQPLPQLSLKPSRTSCFKCSVNK